LEEFVAWIDAPQVYLLSITFFNDIDFDTPELIQFISRTPTFEAYDEAHLISHGREALVRLRPQPEPTDHRMVEVKILCQVSDWQLSSLAQTCTSSLRPLLTMENLYIDEDLFLPLNWKDDIENTEWLDLLLPFTAVKNLYLSGDFTPRIAPALQNVLLEGFRPLEPVQEGIAQFISARQLTSCPVTISVWERNRSSDLPPHSLIEAHVAMNAKYPDDRFDIWPRMAPSGEQEWRVKCLDCPGKVRRRLLDFVPTADNRVSSTFLMLACVISRYISRIGLTVPGSPSVWVRRGLVVHMISAE
jgi:hypothetical protein